MTNPIWGAIGAIFKPIGDWAVKREDRKIKERELQDAAHARAVTAIQHSEDLDQAITLAQINTAGWKDEWFTFLLSIPLVGAFIPRMVPYIEEGFRALDTMPAYYKAFVGSAIAASFGLKTVDRAWKWWNTP